MAASKAEMDGIRENPDLYYAEHGGEDWQPYAPDKRERVGLIAQGIATQRRLIVHRIDVRSQMVNQLENAEAENSVAVVIVDPWTARLEEYQKILSDLDSRSFRNCVVLIPWNSADRQTRASRDELRVDLKKVLERHYLRIKGTYFRADIEEHGVFCSELAGALADLEAILAQLRQPVRRIGISDQTEPPEIDPSGSTS
jgi:FxsC-like protein